MAMRQGANAQHGPGHMNLEMQTLTTGGSMASNMAGNNARAGNMEALMEAFIREGQQQHP